MAGPDPSELQRLIRGGPAPWFTDPASKLHFLRPLSSLLLAADHALFGRHAAFWHAHSIAWYAALVLACAALYRRFISVPWVAGNIREQPFDEIWKTSPVFQRIRGLKIRDYAKCSPCGHKEYCRRDRSSAYTTTGDYTGANPFTCATAELVHRLADEKTGHAEASAVAAPARATVADGPLVNVSVRRLAIAR